MCSYLIILKSLLMATIFCNCCYEIWWWIIQSFDLSQMQEMAFVWEFSLTGLLHYPKKNYWKIDVWGHVGIFSFFLHLTFMVFIDVRKLNHYFLFSVLKEFFMLHCSLFLGPFTKLLGHKKDINSPPSL